MNYGRREGSGAWTQGGGLGPSLLGLRRWYISELWLLKSLS